MADKPGVQQSKQEAGAKFDAGKARIDLIAPEMLLGTAEILDFGAKKYARDNWKHVEGGETRYLAAAFRHLAAHNRGEKVDSETGISHLAHAGCCVLFLLALEKKNG